MGLQSALSTALTGMTAAETKIDVVGNNVANASTVGFKAAAAIFTTQFLSTQSLGSSPTAFNGGTNPRQIGMGTKIAEITPDFTPGTVEISSNPSDLAIQGDGFFIVQGPQGDLLYTRNGIFKTNASNELVNVNGYRLLGYGTDSNFEVTSTELTPLTIPLGASAVAQATRNVYLQGELRPNGDLANQATILQSDIFGDAAMPSPAVGGATPIVVAGPAAASTATLIPGGGALDAGSYQYRVAFIDAQGNETFPSPASAAMVAGAGDEIQITLPPAPGGSPMDWAGRVIYRSLDGGDFIRLAVVNDPATTANYVDGASQASIAANPVLDATPGTGTRTYEYRVVYSHSLGAVEPSRPSPVIGQVTVTGDNRVLLSGMPDTVPPPYDSISIYRTLPGDDTFRLVTTIPPVPGGTKFIDGMSDAQLALQPPLDLDGPKASASSTLLLNLLRRDGDTYEQVFAEAGVLSFTGRKGGRSMTAKEFVIDSSSTLADLLNFIEDAMGIQENTDPVNPIPQSVRESGGMVDPGAVVVGGRLMIVGNNGTANSLEIPLSGLQLRGGSGQIHGVTMPFGTVQQAKGESVATEFLTYDSLGIPVRVRVTMSQEARTSTTTTYRWFAESGDSHDGTGSANIAVGTGLVTFDGNGKVIAVTEDTVSIQRRNVSSNSPLEFDLDFSALSGLGTTSSSLNAARQDGSPPGTLSSYIIGEDGVIRGVFSNGITRDLGQVVLARFANNAGLEQRGENLFAAGVNSGLAIIGTPNQAGNGRIIAGALELSNTDIGSNLVDLILASTQYRGNARVIDATQRLFDELLNLRT